MANGIKFFWQVHQAQTGGGGEGLKVLRRNPSAILPNDSASPEFSWNSLQWRVDVDVYISYWLTLYSDG